MRKNTVLSLLSALALVLSMMGCEDTKARQENGLHFLAPVLSGEAYHGIYDLLVPVKNPLYSQVQGRHALLTRKE